MTKAATILVLGDPGPFRKELLVHKEIEVIWACDVEAARKIFETIDIDACIVSPDLSTEVNALKDELKHIPCIALQPPGATGPRPDFESLVEIDEVDSLVSLLGEHTGIQFARYPRADVSAPVSVRQGGRIHNLQSIDLSLSGIGIANFPPAQVGTRVDLVVELADRSLNVPARVVRWFEHDGGRAAGLIFTSLSDAQKDVIGAAVKSVLQWEPAQRLSAEALFGDLGLEEAAPAALQTMDVAGPSVPAFVLKTQDLELPLLTQILDGDAYDAPDWLLKVATELTALEASAVRGRACPAWVHRALRLRLHFAQSSRVPEGQKIPSALLDEAYRTFESLKEEMDGASATTVAQIAKIRADLLRNIVSARKRPLPVPRVDEKTNLKIHDDNIPLPRRLS